MVLCGRRFGYRYMMDETAGTVYTIVTDVYYSWYVLHDMTSCASTAYINFPDIDVLQPTFLHRLLYAEFLGIMEGTWQFL
jgi:hypothetical protein